jgi:hypothetical protein
VLSSEKWKLLHGMGGGGGRCCPYQGLSPKSMSRAWTASNAPSYVRALLTAECHL